MTARASLGVALAWLVLLPMQARAATLRGIAIDQAFNADPLPADLPGTVPTIVRLLLDEAQFRGQTAAGAFARLEDVLAQYQARNIQVILALGQFPAVDTDVEAWRETIACHRGAQPRSRSWLPGRRGPAGRRAGRESVRLPAEAGGRADPVGRRRRACNPRQRLPHSTRHGRPVCLPPAPAPYIDGVALAGPSPDDDAAFRSAVQGMVALIEREKPAATMLLGPIRLPADPGDATSRARRRRGSFSGDEYSGHRIHRRRRFSSGGLRGRDPH